MEEPNKIEQLTKLLKKLHIKFDDYHPKEIKNILEDHKKKLVDSKKAWIDAMDKFQNLPENTKQSLVDAREEIMLTEGKAYKKAEAKMNLEEVEDGLRLIQTIIKSPSSNVHEDAKAVSVKWIKSSFEWMKRHKEEFQIAASEFNRSEINWFHSHSNLIPPVPFTLICSVFSEFVDDCDNEKIIPTIVERRQVDELIDVLRKDYTSDVIRLEEVKFWMNKFLGNGINLTRPYIIPHSHSQRQPSNETATSENEADMAATIAAKSGESIPILLVEGKLKDAGERGIQNNLNYINWMFSFPEKLLDQNVMPCFLVEITRESIVFSGMVSVIHPYCETLASVSFMNTWEDLPRWSYLLRVLKAFKNAMSKMSTIDSYEKIGSRSSLGLHQDILSLENKVEWQFGNHETIIENKSLVMIVDVKRGPANLIGKKAILKYAPISYGIELQNQLHTANMAPELYFVHKINSRWLLICMEYLDGWFQLEILLKKLATDQETAFTANALKSLEILSKTLKSTGLVHGDLRSPNILWNVKGELKIIDFDWSGKKCYPATVNADLNWPEDLNTSMEIKSSHDEYWIQIMTRMVKAISD